MTRTCASRPAPPSSTAPCPLEPVSTWWGTWTQVSENIKYSSAGLSGCSVFDPVTLSLPLVAGTNFDYIREFRRTTGTWHRTKQMLPSDLSKTACANLRIANCRLFRLQLSQGMFRIRIWAETAAGSSVPAPCVSTFAHWYALSAVGLSLYTNTKAL